MTGSTEKEKRDRGKRYLLILPCSKKKRDVAAAPAIELYNGPFYQILRKQRSLNLDVLVLSAKYGLIDVEKIITSYDQKMTERRALELSKSVREKLEKTIATGHHKEIFVNLGSTYMAALCVSKDVLDRCNTSYATGRIGERMQQLRNWITRLTNGELQ